MGTARTHGGRPCREIHARLRLIDGLRRQLQRLADDVGDEQHVELALVGHFAGHLAGDVVGVHPHLLFQDGHQLFDDQHFIDVVRQLRDEQRVHRVRADLQVRHGHVDGCQRFFHVEAGDAGGDDAELRAFLQFQAVPRGRQQLFAEGLLLQVELFEQRAGVLWQHHEPLQVLGELHRALRFRERADGHARLAVGHARRRPEHDRRLVFLRELEGVGDHVFGLLGRRRVQAGHFGEFRVHAAVLLVLGRVAERVVGGEDDHAADHARMRQRHERVCRDVQPDVLHGHDRSRARPGGSGRHFQGHLLVDRPLDVKAHFTGMRRQRGQYLRGRRARIPGRHVHPGLQQPAGDRLVAQ